MGVSLPPPEQPGAQVLRVLVVSPYALTLLGAMLALTLLIWGEKVQFVDLSLLSAAYSTLFLVMAGVSDYFFGFWGSLLIGTGLVLLLTYFLFRKLESRALKRLIYGLVAFFTVAYPLSGLLPLTEQQNAFNIMVQVGLILYLVILSIRRRDQQTA
jgi:CDP-diglyceride synthetase